MADYDGYLFHDRKEPRSVVLYLSCYTCRVIPVVPTMDFIHHKIITRIDPQVLVLAFGFGFILHSPAYKYSQQCAVVAESL